MWFGAGLLLALLAVSLIGALATRVMSAATSSVPGVASRVDSSNSVGDSLKATEMTKTLSPTLLTDKPKGDTRTYQYVTLPNGLKVVNIRDASTTQAALSVAVDAGSMDNPKELPGLAHFCEHMLFLGTKEYPDFDGFDKFIAQAGGYNNAFTADEHTVYFLEVSESSSVEAMKRFADFFRDPLFNETYVGKEVNAIDSEHQKNVQDQDRRTFEIFNALSNPKSPLSKFKTGTAETLVTIPKEKGLNPVDELKAWFKEHYCPSRMRLATFGPQSLEEQLKKTSEEFGDIPAGSIACQKQRKAWSDPAPWTSATLGKFVAIEGITPQSELWIHFPLPDIQSYYKANPVSYMNYVITYGGENSLSRTLQDTLGLVNSFGFTGSGGSYGYDMYIVARLTDGGRTHVEQIMDVFFAYLAKVKSQGVNSDLYQSLADVSKLEWDWSETDKPADTVSGMAESMFTLAAEDLLSGSQRIDQVNTTLVNELMDKIRPDNMNVAIVDPKAEDMFFKGQQVLTLEHYGARYSVRPLSTQLPGAEQRWQSWLDAGAAGTDAVKAAQHGLDISLKKASLTTPEMKEAISPVVPKAIEAVPKEISTTHMEAAKATSGGAVQNLYGQGPELLTVDGGEGAGEGGDKNALTQKAGGGKLTPQLWYRSGWVTTSPKMYITLDMAVPRTSDSWEVPVLDSMKLSLYGSLLGEEMNPKMYDLSMTGVSFGVSFAPHTMSFSFSGFAPMMPTLMDRVLGEFDKGVDVTNPARYNRLIAKLRQNLETFSEMPVQYAIQDRTLLLTPGMRAREEQVAVIDKLKPENVASSVDDILKPKRMQTIALAMGNIDEPSAKASFKKIQDRAEKWKGASAEVGPDEEVRRFSPVVKVAKPVELRHKNMRPGDQNDAIVISLLVGVSTVENRVILGLISSVLHNVAYTELRTRRNLGYVVNAGVSPISNVQYVSAVVQGVKKEDEKEAAAAKAAGTYVAFADELEGAVESVYTDLMPKTLANLTETEFAAHSSSLEQELLQPPSTFDAEVSHFWNTISEGGDCFQLKDEMLAFLKSGQVTKDTLLQTWNDIALPKEGTRRKIMVKHFANSVPPRPTKEKAREMWKKQGVPDNAIALLEKEYDAATMLDKATSEERAKLTKEGGYYPTDLHCTRAASGGGNKDGEGASLAGEKPAPGAKPAPASLAQKRLRRNVQQDSSAHFLNVNGSDD